MKKHLTKKNIFYFIQFCILVFGISFPFWQTTEVFEIYHPLWIIIPGSIFVLLFSLAFGTFFDLRPAFNKILKKIVAYWLGGGFILFFMLLIFLGINTLLNYPITYVVAIAISCASLAIAYAYYHGYVIHVEHINVHSPKITKPHTFVQLSDIHIGSNTKHDLERIIQKLEPLEYDFIVITGDLVDEDYAHFDDLAPLNKLSEPIYYITGNHEYYLRHKNFAEFIEKTNIHDINDSKISFGEIDIYGIDEKSSVGEVLSQLKIDTTRYTLGLMHEPNTPELREAEKHGIDLMLSGHTHNGQIWPFTLMVKMRYKFIQGLYTLGNMMIHVSSGTSTWGPKMRLGTRNEITHITIYPK